MIKSSISVTQDLLNNAVKSACAHFTKSNLQETEIAISSINLSDAKAPVSSGFRNNIPIYPASLVKLFYLVATHQWIEDGKLKETKELQRAMHDMIIESSNDATHYLIDIMTGTTSGPELEESEMKDWSYKRHAINRYFTSLGYQNINVCQKPWGDGPYGRENIFVGTSRENRNLLTAEATAKLLSQIVLGQTASEKRSKQMLDLLKRDITKSSDDPDDQATKFIGKALPEGSLLWSKAGWTSTVRHDAAYVKLPNGKHFILVIFTTNQAKNYELIPYLTKFIISN